MIKPTLFILFFLATLNAANGQSPVSMMARKQIPVLCWHQIRDWCPTDSKTSFDYVLSVAAFKMHIKMLADSGYHKRVTAIAQTRF